MLKSRYRIIFVYLILLIALSANAQDNPRLAVLPLIPGEHITDGNAMTVTSILRTYLHNTGKFTMINRSDIESIAENHAVELAICSDDACLLEIGSLLGAQKIVVGDIGQFGDKFFLNARIVNLSGLALEDEHSATSSFIQTDVEQGVKVLVERLLGSNYQRITRLEKPSTTNQYETSSTKINNQNSLILAIGLLRADEGDGLSYRFFYIKSVKPHFSIGLQFGLDNINKPFDTSILETRLERVYYLSTGPNFHLGNQNGASIFVSVQAGIAIASYDNYATGSVFDIGPTSTNALWGFSACFNWSHFSLELRQQMMSQNLLFSITPGILFRF